MIKIKKTGSDNLNKITAPNQDNKIVSMSPVEEMQKTEKLEGLDTDTVLLLAANAFEGFLLVSTAVLVRSYMRQNIIKIHPNKLQ